jgi:mono/diheme cytochrome c family protein
MVAGLSPRRALRAAVLAVALAAAAGCEAPVSSYPEHLTFPPRADLIVDRLPAEAPQDPGPPQDLDKFLARIDGLGGRTFDPAALPAEQRARIQQALTELFGTPASPAVAAEGDARPPADRLGLTSERLAEGGRLFRRHCQQCHGISGDGRGPTGLWITPHPRDFRSGVFKFVSTAGTGPRKPCRADLLRTLRAGLPGSRMPAFELLPEDQLDLLAGYVTFLSVRGQVEATLLKALLDPAGGGPEADVPTDARAALRAVLGQWLKAEGELMRPSVPPDLDGPGPWPAADEGSLRRGLALFTDAQGPTACVTCHEDFGRRAKYRFDVWGTLVRPADLTGRVTKGGGRPIDLYCRLRGGIGPSGMPAVTALSDDQIWDLVRFVRALPYPAQLPPDVRGRVYPEQAGSGVR